MSTTTAWAMVNGRLMPLADARIPANDPGFTQGWTVFETMRVRNGSVPLLEEHLQRLHGSAAEVAIEVPDLLEEIATLAAKTVEESRIRITLSGSGLRVLTVEPVPVGRRGAPVRCATGPAAASPLLSGAAKHGSRAAWVAGVKRSGMDDLLLVDEQGRFTEATTAGILAIVGGVIYTAAFDGRILESTTTTELLEIAGQLGIPVVRAGAVADGPFDALYVASATRGLAPVVELDGRVLPSLDPIGRLLTAEMG